MLAFVDAFVFMLKGRYTSMSATIESRLNSEVGFRLGRAARAFALVYPVLLVATFYGTWFLGWLTLGHPPRVSLDDPADTLGWIYWASGVVVMLMPLGIVASIGTMAFGCLSSDETKATTILPAVIHVALWTVVAVHLRSDPIGVVNWWLD